MSYIVEVKESANSAWIANGVRFATVEEAEFAKDALAGRWFGPVGFRTAESTKPANYTWADGESHPIPGTMADNAQNVCCDLHGEACRDEANCCRNCPDAKRVFSRLP